MNVLIISQAAWDNQNSVGNTYSNWFEDWNDDHFFHFYTRKQLPNNSVVEKYYNIAATDIIKGKFNGKTFSREDLNLLRGEYDKAHEKEQANIDSLRESSSIRGIANFAMDLIWWSKLWLNKSFKKFVNDASPDVLFAFATNQCILWPAIKYLKKEKNTRVVLFIADDCWGEICNQGQIRRNYNKRLYRKCLENADVLFGASEELCTAYNQIFDLNITPLYKCCHFETAVKERVNSPMVFSYAGNLLYGRAETLAKVADALEEINKDGVKVKLEIYTGATITPELIKMLNRNGTSEIMGKRSYDDIKKKLSDSDIVLHVESFEREQINCVRYSFSTKIIDCLQSGTNMLAIGPDEAASIDYFKKIPGAFWVNDVYSIKEVIEDIIGHKTMLMENANRVREFAIKHHGKNSAYSKLIKAFTEW